MNEALVRYICRAPSHALTPKTPREAATTSPVTIHEKDWAFCPAGASTDHEWHPIEPTGLSGLKRRHTVPIA
ncbi:MAG TPA: hypothetical protein VGR87_04380 [Candidatus Limnocylindria bacterium]|jgi:hypothetical protein|nr:hypothetical protein [Candidatus Limnocylindria bacterium]